MAIKSQLTERDARLVKALERTVGEQTAEAVAEALDGTGLEILSAPRVMNWWALVGLLHVPAAWILGYYLVVRDTDARTLDPAPVCRLVLPKGATLP